jgi:hypothetical protein
MTTHLVINDQFSVVHDRHQQELHTLQLLQLHQRREAVENETREMEQLLREQGVELRCLSLFSTVVYEQLSPDLQATPVFSSPAAAETRSSTRLSRRTMPRRQRPTDRVRRAQLKDGIQQLSALTKEEGAPDHIDQVDVIQAAIRTIKVVNDSNLIARQELVIMMLEAAESLNAQLLAMSPSSPF